MSINACSGDTTTWDQEVKLLDGRKIVVTQKRLLQGLLTRDAWLTINLPQISQEPIVWHESLYPMVVNIFNGSLYVVAMPSTVRERHRYGDPSPPNIGFRWVASGWQRIPFNEIPEAIYDANMLVSELPPKLPKLLTLDEKNSTKMNQDPDLPEFDKHISPKLN
ncbi:hypothetical protein [Undibacterium sp. SXout20W]|uniref:hypothetical protein n=1 Tax=Undibacterium sp. SXout20W TaxID=3413051 RepID=UPI003BF1C1AE